MFHLLATMKNLSLLIYLVYISMSEIQTLLFPIELKETGWGFPPYPLDISALLDMLSIMSPAL